jgi:hypothetical protein
VRKNKFKKFEKRRITLVAQEDGKLISIKTSDDSKFFTIQRTIGHDR